MEPIGRHCKVEIIYDICGFKFFGRIKVQPRVTLSATNSGLTL
jgi:hypothetical protein